MNFDPQFIQDLLSQIDPEHIELLKQYLQSTGEFALNQIPSKIVTDRIIQPVENFIFEHIPQSKNNPDFKKLQKTFNKLLAKEIESPGTYSIATANQIAEMSNKTAKLFKNLCSISMVAGPSQLKLRKKSSEFKLDEIQEIRTFYFDTHKGTSISNYDPLYRLKKYGFNRKTLRELSTHRLISLEHGNYFEGSVQGFYCGNNYWFIRKEDGSFSWHNFAGIPFTHIGIEIFTLIDFEPNEQYLQELKDFFDKEGLELYDLKKDINCPINPNTLKELNKLPTNK